MSPALRRLAAWLHLYVGLAAGLVLIVVALSGSVLVFKDEIDAALAPELHRVEVPETAAPAPLDAVVASVREALPGHVPSLVRLPRSAQESVEVWTDGEDGPRGYVDPYTGRFLGSQAATASVTGWLVALHVDLLAGEFGHQVVGASALVLLLLMATGLWLAWPRRPTSAGWRRVLGVRSGGSWRRTNHDLHRASGWWSLPTLMVLAVTGASLVYHDAFARALNALTASEAPVAPPRSVAPAGAAVDFGLQAGLATADAALPGGRATWVYLPLTPEATLTVRKRMPGEWHPNGRSYVYVDRFSGAVLHAHDATRAELGTRLYDLLYPLHIGRFGLWSKLLWAILGLAPVLLAVGGTLIWWDRRRRAVARAAQAGPVRSSDAPTGLTPPAAPPPEERAAPAPRVRRSQPARSR